MTDDDPYLARLRTICLALPGAVEGSSHGRPVFRTTKAFVNYRYGPKGGEHRPDHTLVVLPDPEDEAALRADERFFVPAYLGSAGWLGTDLSDGGATAPDAVDWAEVAELVEASYRRTAPARLVRELDAGEAPA
ncbi:MmcQ/YjbR family DNA-binding protein [Actinotalea caeni]|uniref:MmcQ/YjbR family DNA-binding protein n=1 Tax=Actinotalea caeni TaxID=1348467 RepID=UPI0012E217C6|nr:MmcQ/YjbR family DNA-binding protein [Actinotalea caeni]